MGKITIELKINTFGTMKHPNVPILLTGRVGISSQIYLAGAQLGQHPLDAYIFWLVSKSSYVRCL